MAVLTPGFSQHGAAQQTVEQAKLRSGNIILTWKANEAFRITYDGHPVFAPYANQLTVHNPEWSAALYRSRGQFEQAILTRKGSVQELKIRYRQADLRWSQTITAGPGNRLRIEYVYRQDRWDGMGLELGVARPVEEFWAGSLLDVLSGQTRGLMVVPISYNPVLGSHPLKEAYEFRLHSRFGTLYWKSTQPVMLWDYQSRGGAFVIGFDRPLPRGQEIRFAVQMEMAPPKAIAGGIRVDRVECPSKVNDGFLRAGLVLARTISGPSTVKALLRVKTPTGKESVLSKTIPLSAKPTRLEHRMVVLEEGDRRADLVIAAKDGKELIRVPGMPVRVGPMAAMGPDRSFYTSEKQGFVMIDTVAALEGRKLTANVLYEGKAISSGLPVTPGRRSLVPFPLDALPQGASQIACRLLADGKELLTLPMPVQKLPPKPNEVKIDYTFRGLIVDGLPYLPFGFYCDVAPAAALATEEAPQGFNLLSPYQGSSKGRLEQGWEQIRAYMDRCAAVGMKVNYHLMGTATLPPSEEKWALLKAEVEAFRDHPALLSWYIADEPDGQGIVPALLEETYRFIKDLDPYHPITIVLMTPSRVHDYLKSMDIIMADPYPIPNGPVTTVSDWADTLNRAAGYRTPLWIVPQAFGGGEWWAREPSASEERVMTYLALIHGATGIQYWPGRSSPGRVA